jgi:hypothetical protein
MSSDPTTWKGERRCSKRNSGSPRHRLEAEKQVSVRPRGSSRVSVGPADRGRVRRECARLNDYKWVDKEGRTDRLRLVGFSMGRCSMSRSASSIALCIALGISFTDSTLIPIPS